MFVVRRLHELTSKDDTTLLICFINHTNAFNSRVKLPMG